VSGEASARIEQDAGYVSPFPYAVLLQDKMDEILDEQVPRSGHFCGYCYGRIAPDADACAFCETSTSERSVTNEIPLDVLRIYKQKKSIEALWVHSGAMVGLLTSAALFIILVVWGPGLLGHPGVAFTVLIGGGYVLAKLFGGVVAAQFGYRAGSRKRDAAWRKYLEERDGPGD
jgi:hypothetical protein